MLSIAVDCGILLVMVDDRIRGKVLLLFSLLFVSLTSVSSVRHITSRFLWHVLTLILILFPEMLTKCCNV